MFTQKDHFLSEGAFERLLEYSREAAFADVRNDCDGVVYPHICNEVPNIVRKEVEFLAGQRARYLFLRRSPAGVAAPHQVHTDNSMGRTSFMLYLQDAPELEGHALAGTSFLRHRALGVAYAPAVEELVRLCQEHTNTAEAWAVHSHCPMKANRACIFDAGYFHRADPIGGFGEGASARCVLTGFFA